MQSFEANDSIIEDLSTFDEGGLIFGDYDGRDGFEAIGKARGNYL